MRAEGQNPQNIHTRDALRLSGGGKDAPDKPNGSGLQTLVAGRSAAFAPAALLESDWGKSRRSNPNRKTRKMINNIDKRRKSK